MDSELAEPPATASSDRDANGASSEGEAPFPPHLRTLRAVGQGGIGRVLLGFDLRIGREVAIKELLPSVASSERVRNRFIREAKITGRLEHPGIIPVYELGARTDGQPYYVMKFVRGQTLSEALRTCTDEDPDRALRKRLRLLDALIDSCHAVGYAHARGVVHRDLKPANIILGAFGETVILDWGLAHVGWSAECRSGMPEPDHTGAVDASELDDLPLTLPGEILGTPAYMAPEQIEPGRRAVDCRSDVFSLGCILFQILTGRPPFEGPSRTILIERRSRVVMPSVRSGPAKIPADLAAICDTALAATPEERYQDAGAMAQELRNFRDGHQVGAYTYSTSELVRRFVGKNRAAVIAALITLLTIVIGAAVAVRFALLADQARALAEVQRARAEATLVEVAGGLQRNLEQARTLARQIRAETNGLAIDLADALVRLKASAITDAAAVAPVLRAVHDRHPHVNKIVLSQPPGIITAIYPALFAGQIGADLSGLAHMQWTIANQARNFSRIFTTIEGTTAVSLQYPWIVDGRLIGVLSAVFDPGELIGSLVPETVRDVWVLQHDGVILYTGDRSEIGFNLFSDAALTRYPQLRSFARLIQREDDGIRHVEVRDATGVTINWVAAWATFTASSIANWKVVIAEPYVVETGDAGR